MKAGEFRHALDRLGLSQAEAARLLGVKLRTVQRWAAGSPEPAEPAAQALRAWCRLAERGFAWRPDEIAVEIEDPAGLAETRRRALALDGVGSGLGAAVRKGARRWRVNVERCRATSGDMVVHFNRLADGSFLPASYRRLDRLADPKKDRFLIAQALASFLRAARRGDAARGSGAAAFGRPAAEQRPAPLPGAPTP